MFRNRNSQLLFLNLKCGTCLFPHNPYTALNHIWFVKVAVIVNVQEYILWIMLHKIVHYNGVMPSQIISLNIVLNRLFRRKSKKTSKLCVTGLCVGNSPVAGEFPAQRSSDVENVSIYWRHHATETREIAG